MKVPSKAIRFLATAILVFLIVLSFASGLLKFVPLESVRQHQLIAQGSSSETVIVAFGALQILGGLLLSLRRSRRVGAVVICGTYLLATVGYISQGLGALIVVPLLVSLLPLFLLWLGFEDRQVEGLAPGEDLR